jgi:hypothetical protein
MFISLCNATGSFIAFSRYVSSVDDSQHSSNEASFTLTRVAVSRNIYITACFVAEFSCCAYILIYSIINKIINNCIVLTPALSFFPKSSSRSRI